MVGIRLFCLRFASGSLERQGCEIAELAVRPLVVVVVAKRADPDTRFCHRGEAMPVQARVTQRGGYCGAAMHGYTSTKTKPSGRTYKYRKYRCAGRVNNPGACHMPILSADAIFSDIAQRDGERLQDEISTAIERHRVALLEALRLLEEQLPALAQQREEALVAVISQSLPVALKKAIAERADRLVAEYQENEAQQQQIRAAIGSLTTKARSVLAVLTDPNLDRSRWQEPAVFAVFRRAFALLVRKAVVSEVSTRSAFSVHLTVTTNPIAAPQNGSVVNLASTRARASVDSRLIITETITIKK